MAKILLIINLQKEFKDHAGMYESVLKYCKDSYGNYDVILPTLFSNDYNINPNFVDKLNYEHCVHTVSYGIKSIDDYLNTDQLH